MMKREKVVGCNAEKGEEKREGKGTLWSTILLTKHGNAFDGLDKGLTRRAEDDSKKGVDFEATSRKDENRLLLDKLLCKVHVVHNVQLSVVDLDLRGKTKAISQSVNQSISRSVDQERKREREPSCKRCPLV